MGLFSGIAKAAGSLLGGGETLGAVGGLLDSSLPILGAAGSILGQSSANSANRDIAQQQMAFQQYNSNTAYQRAVEDMRLAGLNPMLAYSQGGASTPSGSSATMMDSVTPGINSANNARQVTAAVNNMEAQVDQTKSQTDLNKVQAVKAAADAKLSATSAANIAQQTIAGKSSADFSRTWFGRNISPALGNLSAILSSAKTAATLGK